MSSAPRALAREPSWKTFSPFCYAPMSIVRPDRAMPARAVDRPDRGRILLSCSMEEFETEYVEVMVNPGQVAAVRALKPIHERQAMGRSSLVAAARRWLGATAGAPIAGERRVVLIEGADRVGEQIQNALLKALEEPSDRHVFILVADEPNRLLETVRSRCQPLRIGPVPRAELSAWLMDHELLPKEQADAVARISDGFVGRALAFSRQHERLEWRRRVQRELVDLLGRGRAERFVSARELLDDEVAVVPFHHRLDVELLVPGHHEEAERILPYALEDGALHLHRRGAAGACALADERQQLVRGLDALLETCDVEVHLAKERLVADRPLFPG